MKKLIVIFLVMIIDKNFAQTADTTTYENHVRQSNILLTSARNNAIAAGICVGIGSGLLAGSYFMERQDNVTSAADEAAQWMHIGGYAFYTFAGICGYLSIHQLIKERETSKNLSFGIGRNGVTLALKF